MRSSFDHERLDAYKTALEFLVMADETASAMPQGRAYLAAQLRRAACSIALNIAEGAGEFSPVEKARFYRMARRSATECAAILDIARTLELAGSTPVARGRDLLLRIVAILVAMTRAPAAPASSHPRE